MGRPSLNLTDEQKRTRRLKRNKENMKHVKPDQVGVCRFIEVEIQDFIYNITLKKYERTGSHTRFGLQYENLVYFEDGTSRNLNDSSVRAIKIYDAPPSNIPEKLEILHIGFTMFDFETN
jgi:hypothetical protein